MPCVWDGHFDTMGRRKGGGELVVTSDKLRGPESNQIRKIGEHICLVRARTRRQAAVYQGRRGVTWGV